MLSAKSLSLFLSWFETPNAAASAYLAQVKSEKLIADMRNMTQSLIIF